jgi:Ca-activated chloride channel family protein
MRAWALLGIIGLTAACGGSSDSSTSASDALSYSPTTGGGSTWSAGAGGASGTSAAGGSGPAHATAGAGGAALTGGAGGATVASACSLLDPTKSNVLYQSPDDSNSMASPALVRRLIRAGQQVPPGLVRTYEFLNYYRIAYEPAEGGHVRVVPELRPGKTEGEYSLQIGLVSEKAASPRRPMTLTFVLDTSGSMAGDRFQRAMAALNAIAAQLAPGDVISLVTWNTQVAVPLQAYAVKGPSDPVLLTALSKLSVDSSTDLDGGLKKGYAIASSTYDPSRMNRVVLISDGEANVGQTNADIIGASSHMADDEGIYMVGVNVGTEAGDTLMNIVTDKGRGASVFLDSTAEAASIFGSRFDETMEISARGVRLELTMPWYMQMKSFSGEQSSTNPDHVDPQHLAPNDAMVFVETWAPCDPSMVVATDTVTAKATYQAPLTHEAREDVTTSTLGDLLAAPADHLAKGAAIVAYAETLKKAPTLSPIDASALVDKTIAQVKAANPKGTDPELTEIASLLAIFHKTP